MIKKMLLLAAGLMLLTAAPALAQADDGYTTTNVQGDVQENGSVVLSGDNCPPNSTVTYEVTDSSDTVVDSGSTTADSSGSFSTTTAALDDGSYTITITCGDDVEVLSVTVGATTTTAAGGALPETGSDSSIPMARLGMILVAAGGVAVYAGKKRQGRRAAFIDA